MKKIAVIGANAPLLPFYKQAYAMGYRLIGIAWEEGAYALLQVFVGTDFLPA